MYLLTLCVHTADVLSRSVEARKELEGEVCPTLPASESSAFQLSFAVFACVPGVQYAGSHKSFCHNIFCVPTTCTYACACACTHTHTHTHTHLGPLQTPLAFPWADDLLGEFLRRLRQERKKHPRPKQEPKPEQAPPQQSQQAQPPIKQESQQELHPPSDASGSVQGSHQNGVCNGFGGAHCNGSHQQHSVGVNGMNSSVQGNGVMGGCEGKHSPQANG